MSERYVRRGAALRVAGIMAVGLSCVGFATPPAAAQTKPALAIFRGVPELDARAIPHAIRHATIFGALDGLRPGAALVLTADHDPVPLRAQLEQRAPGSFGVTYLEEGPQVWRLRLTRRA